MEPQTPPVVVGVPSAPPQSGAPSSYAPFDPAAYLTPGSAPPLESSAPQGYAPPPVQNTAPFTQMPAPIEQHQLHSPDTREGYGQVPTAQPVYGAQHLAPAPGQFGAPGQQQQQQMAPVQQQLGAPAPQAYGAPTPQYAAPTQVVAPIAAMQCGHCHRMFALPPNANGGKSNETLCLAAVFCIIGCWPCALCVFLGDSSTSVNCPMCGKENVIR